MKSIARAAVRALLAASFALLPSAFTTASAAPMPRSDLQVPAASDPPATGSPGDVFTVDDTTLNIGRGVGSSVTGFLLSLDDRRDTGDVLLDGEHQVPRLKKGEESSSTTQVRIPVGTPDDSYHVLACADIGASIPEVDETNNCRASATTIELAPPQTAFRITGLALRDPHVWVHSIIGLVDATDGPFGVNPVTEQVMSTDADGDGLIDLSHVTIFQPLDPGATTTPIHLAWSAECSAPLALNCASELPPSLATATNASAGRCLGTIGGTTNSAYSPSVAESTGPCFSTGPAPLVLDLGWVSLSLLDARVAATYEGSPVAGQVNGLIRGFLTQEVAQATWTSAEAPTFARDQILASLLPGGPGNGAVFDDRDSVGGVVGWWIYLNFLGVPTGWAG